MALSKQVNIYSLDTSSFYDFYESSLDYNKRPYNAQIKRLEYVIGIMKTAKNKLIKKLKEEYGDEVLSESIVIDNEVRELLTPAYEKDFRYIRTTRFISIAESKLAEFRKFKEKRHNSNRWLLVGEEEISCRDSSTGEKTKVKIPKGYFKTRRENGLLREVREIALAPSNVISIFDSSLTRILGMNNVDEIYEDLIVVRAYYFDVLEDLIVDGFYLHGEKYVLLTASAGQIRQKKAVFIKESLYNKHEKTIMCGLSIDKINEKGGMNVNKFMAYMALVSSATDVWEGFDIDKSIVVDDFETDFMGDVDYINYEEEEVDGELKQPYSITRRTMPVTIPHTDGVGIMLDKTTTMVRLPFVKGLMVYTPFDKFIKEHRGDYRGCSKITDIYGVEHDILKEKIRYIFTKSQFKMWKYYDSWEQYKEFFKEYRCEACKCNEEENEEDFGEAKINYQMLQTLTDITDEEMLRMANQTIEEIRDMTLNRKTMLTAFGVEEGSDKSYGSNLQKALSMYPELLQDYHCRETIKQTKASMVKQAWSGRIKVNGKYTFVSPDTYAFCEWLFLGIDNPNGLLKTGEVYCDLFADGRKLDCLRSPHLFLEHAIRKNNRSDLNKKWFKTHCIYTSNMDMISKILQFDKL